MHAPHLAGQLLLLHMPAADKTMQTTTVPTIVQQSDSCNIDEQQVQARCKVMQGKPCPCCCCGAMVYMLIDVMRQCIQ